MIIALSSIFLIFTELGNNVHALHVKVAFFHTLVIHACVLYSTSRLRTADLREMKAYTSIAPFQSTADSWEQDARARTQHVGANCWEGGGPRRRAEPLSQQCWAVQLRGGKYMYKIEKAYGPTAPLRPKNYILIRSR